MGSDLPRYSIQRIFDRIVGLAREKGLISDHLSIVDSTHVRAKVDTFKMKGASPDKDARYPSKKD